MMNFNDIPSVDHVLKKRGILKSFNINREISNVEISQLFRYLGIEEDEASDTIKDDVKNTLLALVHMNADEMIPGVLSDRPKKIKSIRVPELSFTAESIIEMLTEKTENDDECKFIIMKVVTALGLAK